MAVGAGRLWAMEEAPSVGDALVIASGAAGSRQIDRLPTSVPGRAEGRPNWTRERYSAIALIRHLSVVQQRLFPLRVERVDSPDFVFTPHRSGLPPIAVEVTDAGEHEFHRFLDDSAASPGVRLYPSPGGMGWDDDASKQRFSEALREAVKRKLFDKVWRRAADLPRWLVLYDNTNAGSFVSDADTEECLREQVQAAQSGGLSALVLVRSLDSVRVIGCS